MILGLRTAIYSASDITQARLWYEQVLGQPAYFVEPYYVGFSVGGFELGIVPDEPAINQGTHQAFWGVDHIEDEFARLIALGASALTPVTDVGGGTKVASVTDPFGNQFAIIENPHFQLADVR